MPLGVLHLSEWKVDFYSFSKPLGGVCQHLVLGWPCGDKGPGPVSRSAHLPGTHGVYIQNMGVWPGTVGCQGSGMGLDQEDFMGEVALSCRIKEVRRVMFWVKQRKHSRRASNEC